MFARFVPLFVLIIHFALNAFAQVPLISSPLTVFALFNNGSATFITPPALVGTQISGLTIVGQPGPATGGPAFCCTSNGTIGGANQQSKCGPTNIWGCYPFKGDNLFEMFLVGPTLDYNTDRLWPDPSFTSAQIHFVSVYTCPNYQYPAGPYTASNPQQFVTNSTINVVYSSPVTLKENYTFVDSEFYNNKTGLGCSQFDNFGYSKILSIVATPYVAPSASPVLPTSLAASASSAASPSSVPSTSQAAASLSSVPSTTKAAASPSSAPSTTQAPASPTSAPSTTQAARSPTPAPSTSVNNSPASPQCVRCYNNCGGLLQRFTQVCELQLFGTVSVTANAVTPKHHPQRTANKIETRRVRTKGTRTICCNGVSTSKTTSPNFSWNSPFLCNNAKREKLLDLCTLFNGNSSCFALPATAPYGKSYYRCLPKA